MLELVKKLYYKEQLITVENGKFFTEDADNYLQVYQTIDQAMKAVDEKLRIIRGRKSKIIGVMLLHTDGDKEYWEPGLQPEDMDAIFKILEKYDGKGEDIRGNLKVFDE